MEASELDYGQLAAAVARHLDTYQQRASTWRPLPHQVPPEGDWYGWLLNGGRGAGKTATAARYVSAHVHGPPCIPGPTPHWVGIIAPTLGDGVTACFQGPSGLRSFDSDATLVQTTGGTVIRWTNGAQAKLFGAHTQEDVERLRAGGNTCLAAGSLVRTARGEVPIKDATADDLVWTRRGLRRVLRAGQTGVRELWELRTEGGRRLRLTGDHEVRSDRGWRRVDDLEVGDSLVAWGEPSRQTAPRPRLRRPSPPGSGAATSRSPASSAARLAGRGAYAVPARAEARAASSSSVLATGGPHERGSRGCASCAELSSPPSSDVRPGPARDRVRSVSRLGTVEPVYDLLVEHDHEFFADGVLVANCLIWAEELAAWRYLDASWQQMRFGLRTGPRPHWIASTTPKPRALIKKLVKKTPHNVVVTHATTDDNPHLEVHVRAALEEDYGGTQMGRQELYAEILEQDVNALWLRADIDRFRLTEVEVPQLSRVTVGVDPSGGAGEQGIVVVGKATQDMITGGQVRRLGHGYVLADVSCTLSPDGWGKRAVQAAVDWEADDIVVEINFGGDMATSTIAAAADTLGVTIPIRQTRASRGKRVRAEPVSVLSSRGRWHHVGRFEQLEDQMATWVPDESDYSPDRLDAAVWPAWHLRLVGTALHAVGSFGGMAAASEVIA